MEARDERAAQSRMMGLRDYVLGLEPGNCHPDGRKKMREDGTLQMIQPKEEVVYRVKVSMVKGMEMWAKMTADKENCQ